MLVLVAGFLFVVNFSAVESRFECPGEFTLNVQKTQSRVFLKIEEYRWWAGLWSESDGSVRFEIPNSSGGYYGYVRKFGDQLQMSEDASSIVKGSFSKLSRALMLLSTPSGIFDGLCKALP